MPSQLAWIWPRDPRRGNPTHPRRRQRRWRLFDVLTNRGPDIFVGRIDAAKPDQKDGSRQQGRERESVVGKGKGVCADQDEEYGPLPWAKQSPHERYDAGERKYQVPEVGGVQSKAQRCGCEKHVVPVQFWDQYGAEYPLDHRQYGPVCGKSVCL